jgi:hypothetical protein
MPKVIFTILLVFLSVNVVAQKSTTCIKKEKLLINTWKLKSYLINDSTAVPTTTQQNSKFIFYSNHLCDNISNGKNDKGRWWLSVNCDTLFITSFAHENDIMKFKILSSSPKKLELSPIENDVNLKLLLVPEKK